jgi:cystathionine beta-synthase
MSKFFDDAWLEENRLNETEPVAESVGDLLRSRGPRVLITVSPDTTAAEAVELMQDRGISQLPVLRSGRAVGSVQEVTLARLLHDAADLTTVLLGDVMARPLPQVDIGVHLDEVYRLLLSGNSGVLATANDEVVDIVTRIDLIQYWNRRRSD